MLTILNIIDKRGKLIIYKDDVTALMQRHAECEFSKIGFILQRYILPDNSESGT